MKITKDSKFWVVTRARKTSTIEDIKFRTTLEGLQQQFTGGLHASDILTITDDSGLAEQEAEDELITVGAYRLCPVCDGAKPASDWTRTSSEEDGPCDECWKEYNRMLNEEHDSPDRRVLEKYARFAFIEFSDNETAASALHELKTRFPEDRIERTDNYLFFIYEDMKDSIEYAIDRADWLKAARGMTIPSAAIGPRIYNK